MYNLPRCAGFFPQTKPNPKLEMVSKFDVCFGFKGCPHVQQVSFGGMQQSERLLPSGKRKHGNFTSNVFQGEMHLYICIHGPFSRHASLLECQYINIYIQYTYIYVKLKICTKTCIYIYK